MRYELTDCEWAAIKPFLPNRPRGVPRVNDRRVLNGIFWVLRSGAPWRDLPKNFSPYTTFPASTARGLARPRSAPLIWGNRIKGDGGRAHWAESRPD